MTAWLIVTAKIYDRDLFINGYGRAAAELVAEMGGRYILRERDAETLEGPDRDGWSAVISQWPDRATAKAFWNSPAYASVRQLRDGIADCEVLLIGD